MIAQMEMQTGREAEIENARRLTLAARADAQKLIEKLQQPIWIVVRQTLNPVGSAERFTEEPVTGPMHRPAALALANKLDAEYARKHPGCSSWTMPLHFVHEAQA